MDQFAQRHAGVYGRINTVQVEIICRRDRLFQFLQLTIEIHLRIFDRQRFPDQIQDTTVQLAVAKLGLLAEHRVVGVHTLAQAGHKSDMLPAFQLLQAQVNRVL